MASSKMGLIGDVEFWGHLEQGSAQRALLHK